MWPDDENRTLRFLYRNWRGEVALRHVEPVRIWFGSTQWHPKPQWMMRAFCLDRQEERDFCLADMNPTITEKHDG